MGGGRELRVGECAECAPQVAQLGAKWRGSDGDVEVAQPGDNWGTQMGDTQVVTNLGGHHRACV